MFTTLIIVCCVLGVLTILVCIKVRNIRHFNRHADDNGGNCRTCSKDRDCQNCKKFLSRKKQ